MGPGNKGNAAATGFVSSASAYALTMLANQNICFKSPTCNGGEGAGSKNVVEADLSKSKYHESTKHIDDAIKNGHPDTLTIDRGGASANRSASLKGGL